MSHTIIIYPICSKEVSKRNADIVRANKEGLKLFCGKVCFGISRRRKEIKTPEQLKAEKAEYDRRRREEKREELKIKNKLYNESPAGRATQKRARQKRKQYHNEYCRRSDQREKERLRNRKKYGLTETKVCLCCGEEKQKIEFESFPVFPDKRLYMCRSCEEKDIQGLNITIREVLATIRASLVKTESTLKIKDIVIYPYLIEAHKYLLLLKRITR